LFRINILEYNFKQQSKLYKSIWNSINSFC
jgi:hypothetical protein